MILTDIYDLGARLVGKAPTYMAVGFFAGAAERAAAEVIPCY